jgi:hypothetical protein
MTTELNVSEEAAAEMLGIRVAEVKRLRKDELGADGYVVSGRSVRITPIGLKKISAAVRGKIPAAVPELPALRELVVESACPNPKIILCVLDDEKKTRVRCRVRDGKNFTRGMRISGCRMVQETLYAYEGRLPRIKGRWL